MAERKAEAVAMTAQEAKAKVMAVITELHTAGFSVGGHWDDFNILLISRIEGVQDFSEANYAEITGDDLADLYGGDESL